MFPLIFLLLALCVQQLVAVDPVVDLGYAKYRGVQQSNGLIRWQGMRYARSVSRVDGRRFSPPEDPLPERVGTVVDANNVCLASLLYRTSPLTAAQFGPICIGTYHNLKNEFGGNQSEDCLFANVWAPAKAKNNSALPVYIFVQGGGFNDNGNANYNASKLVKAADDGIVVVNFNYRVGPYGFLASKEIVSNGTTSLNNGLKDQRQLLKWVQQHISKVRIHDMTSFGSVANVRVLVRR
jgi:carboxylesterase type B